MVRDPIHGSFFSPTQFSLKHRHTGPGIGFLSAFLSVRTHAQGDADIMQVLTQKREEKNQHDEALRKTKITNRKGK